MKRIRLMSTARGLAVIAALWAFQAFAPIGASAQEVVKEKTMKEKKIVVEVRDGKVFINGKESEAGTNGHITVRKGDGDEMIVVVGENGPTTWVSAFGDKIKAYKAQDEASKAFARAFTLRSELGDDEDEHVFFMEHAPEPMGGNWSVGVDDRLADVFENVEFMGQNMARLRRQSKELREIEAKLREKAREIRRAEDGERAALEAELDALAEQAFDMKLTEERKEVLELEKRLQELQHRFQEREAMRRDIIERRKKELLGRRDNLDW
jgi:hypothetical protein